MMLKTGTLPNQLIDTFTDLDDIADRPPLPAPELPTLKTYKRWPAHKKSELDEQRFIYLHQLPYLHTNDCQQLQDKADDLIPKNRASPGTGQGLVLSGPAFTGKTSALRSLAIRQNRIARKHRPLTDSYSDHIPVIFIQVGAKATPKGVVRQLAAFMKGVHTGTGTNSELMIPLQRDLRACQTELIILDEGHCLTGGPNVGDFVKELLNATSATIILAGIDLANTNVFLGNRRDQNKQRFTELTTTQYHTATEHNTSQWQALIAGFENRLPLLNHPTQSLATKHHNLLFKLTSGAVGSLATLLETAFTNALGTTERIGKNELGNIDPTVYGNELKQQAKLT